MFRKNKKEEVGKIVVAGEYERPDKGGYDRLRDNALFLNADGNTNVLQIESSVAHEGKTTVACNLAVSLGQTGKKTIVAELGFHRPTAHRVFRAESEGIAGYILGTATKEKVIKHTEFENVDVLPRGGEIDNPSLVLISEKFKNLIAELKKGIRLRYFRLRARTAILGFYPYFQGRGRHYSARGVCGNHPLSGGRNGYRA